MTENIDNLPINSGIPKNTETEPNLSISERVQHTSLFDLEFPARLIPPHWSRRRDKFLRDAVINSDGFMIAVYNVLSRISAIIPEVQPLDKLDDTAVFAAKVSTSTLQESWLEEIPKALFDLFTQDNGMFLEVIDGTNDPSKPVQPYEIAPGIFLPAIGLHHWDSARCTRTGNDEFPVVIEGADGQLYPVHKTRILMWTDMPSPKLDQNGVGFCAASRVLTNLIQMTESEEIVSDMLFDGMIGEILFGQPFTAGQLEEAFKRAEERAMEPGSPRYRRFVYVGVQDPTPGFKLEVQRIPLRRLPEGYNKADSMTLFLYLVAAALSADAREVFPATVSGATRADAEQQHKKSRNKFARLWINQMIARLNACYAPIDTTTIFDYTDEAEELEKAEARSALAESHQIELENGTITPSVATEQMFDSGYLTEQQYLEVIESRPQSTVLGQDPTTQRIQSLFTTQSKDLAESQRIEYETRLKFLIHQFESGEITFEELEQDIDDLTMSAILAAYLRGSEKDLPELGDEDFLNLETQSSIFRDSLPGLMDKVLQGTFISLSLWGNTILATEEAAKLMMARNPLLMWTRGDTESPCPTCLSLDGEIRTRGEWKQAGLYPRMKGPTLSCGGWECDCRFVEVENLEVKWVSIYKRMREYDH